jgi:hypothetical protein
VSSPRDQCSSATEDWERRIGRYFDTSALVKLIFEEPGSELAVELWDRADRFPTTAETICGHANVAKKSPENRRSHSKPITEESAPVRIRT